MKPSNRWERCWTLANRCFFCLAEEESTNHILIHCTKTRVLWELSFALFGVTWVLPCSVRETLLGRYGSFVGKKRKKAWKLAPLWAVWKERNRIAFDDEEFSVHRLKNSFVCSFWSWTKLYIDVGPIPLINFFDWLGSRWRWVRFFTSPLFCSSLPHGAYYILPICLGLSSGLPFSNLYIFFYFYL